MNLLKFILLFIILVLCSCRDEVGHIQNQSDNDTLKIIRAALYQGVTDDFMPSFSALKKPYRFGDSVLATSDKLPLDLVSASIQGLKIKVFPKHEICSMIIADSSLTELPNFLNISNFEKSDTGYYVQVKNLSCFPFGGGGSLGLYFKRIKGSWMIIKSSKTSIN